ncbi:DNA-binding transcriptional LysR family regulator [Mesorhizobium soli]|uniref:LysR family transcriptional regulator n=1 Tax=Pseudaminobacter soli (ex Li et al. 2025) TaxID=1295366 RepID=UPI002476685D|nr:LysR family transcriptional regulator [Mesorhizobium soli]MDH6231714.1 DNA-binding transcriptional LysR family regulator [Mesorhizobium soli]
MSDTRGIDLNLLRSLDVLIEEANVTHAAARLGVTQPGLSAQLARLRAIFDDPLLVPSEKGRGMLPTSRALELREPLHAALKDLEAVIRTPAQFDPRTDARTFAIATTDNAVVVLGLPLIERLREAAGRGIRLSFANSGIDVATELERGEIDLLVGSDRMVPPAMKARKLLEESYVMVQRKGHPRGRAPLDLDAYCKLEHVLVSTSGGSFHGFIDEQLEKLGYRRSVTLSVHQFVMAPMIVASTDFVSTLPRRFAARFADRLDLFELPFSAQGFSLFAAWHPRAHADPALMWLRNQLIEIARE